VQSPFYGEGFGCLFRLQGGDMQDPSLLQICLFGDLLAEYIIERDTCGLRMLLIVQRIEWSALRRRVEWNA
jgi:hypothetical protein